MTNDDSPGSCEIPGIGKTGIHSVTLINNQALRLLTKEAKTKRIKRKKSQKGSGKRKKEKGKKA